MKVFRYSLVLLFLSISFQALAANLIDTPKVGDFLTDAGLSIEVEIGGDLHEFITQPSPTSDEETPTSDEEINSTTNHYIITGEYRTQKYNNPSEYFTNFLLIMYPNSPKKSADITCSEKEFTVNLSSPMNKVTEAIKLDDITNDVGRELNLTEEQLKTLRFFVKKGSYSGVDTGRYMKPEEIHGYTTN